MKGCTCMIAARVNSTTACKAISALEQFDPAKARQIQTEANAHVKRLHKACRCWSPFQTKVKEGA